MRFLKNPKFDPLEARTSGFTGSMGGKRVAGVVFGPKPTPDPNFIKIGVGHRTRPYIRLLHFLTSGLLKGQEPLRRVALPCACDSATDYVFVAFEFDRLPKER